MPNPRDAGIGAITKSLGLVYRQKTWPTGWQPRSILIIKTCCLGDVLMATPSLAALRRAFPGAHLAMLVGTWSKEILAGNANLDEVIDGGSLGSGRSYSMGAYLGLARSLRRRRFDCCFVLERSPLLTALPWLAGIPTRVGLDSAGRGFALNVRVPCPPRRHEAELYLDVVRAAEVSPDHPQLEFFPSGANRLKANEALAGLSAGQGFVALHPGGGVNPGMSLVSKRWPAEYFANVADRLTERGYSVLLVGGASDRGTADIVLAHARLGMVDLVGKMNLGELGAVFQRCRLVVANDTGPMHLAVGVGVQVVAIFGPSDPLVYGPFGQAEGVVTNESLCSPCFVAGRSPECFDHHCLADLAVEKVWATIERRLAARVDAKGGHDDRG